MSDTQFDDGKDEGALRTIGEVSKALGIKTHVLRYWEQQFDVLEPLKRSGGRRYYRPADVSLIERIDQLVNREGYTLKGAQQALAGGVPDPSDRAPAVDGTPSDKPVASTAERPVETIIEEVERVPAETVARLKDIRASLARAIGA